MFMEADWRILFSTCSGSLALALNILLALVISTTKCSYIGKYKYLLLLYTMSAAVYAVCQILTAGNFFLTRDGYMFYDAAHLMPVDLADLVIYTFVSCFIQNLVILTLSFYYRYFVVCNPQGLDRFLNNSVKIAGCSLLIIAYVMFGLMYSMMPSADCEETLSERFFNATGRFVHETAYIGAIIFVRGNFNWGLLFGLGSFGVFITVSGGIIVTLAVKIGKALRKSSYESEAVAKNQKKIFMLLIFQLSLPLLFNIIPLQIVVASSFFRLPTEALVESFGCILTVAQVIDPLLIVYFIKPYQMALYGRLCCKKMDTLKGSQTGPVQQLTSHSHNTVV